MLRKVSSRVTTSTSTDSRCRSDVSMIFSEILLSPELIFDKNNFVE